MSDCPYWAYLRNTGKDPLPERVCEIWGNDITTDPPPQLSAVPVTVLTEVPNTAELRQTNLA